MGRETKTMEIKLLEAWERAGFAYVYRYKSRIKGLMDRGSRTSFELMYDIENAYFEELKDLANDGQLTVDDVAMNPSAMLARRTGIVPESVKIDRKMYREAKLAFRYATTHMKRFIFTGGIILINWYNHEVKYFENRQQATDYLLREMKEWDSVSAGEDEELEVITFCAEPKRKSHAPAFDHYKPFRKLDGIQYYRHRRPVRFEEVVEYYPSF